PPRPTLLIPTLQPRAQLVCRSRVERPAIAVVDLAEDHAIGLAGMFDGNETVENVIEHLARIALQTIPVPAAHRRVIGYRISHLGPQPGEFGRLESGFPGLAAFQLDHAAISGLAAEDPPRRVVVAIRFMRHEPGRQI